MLFGVPFALVGVYLIVGRFFYQQSAKKRTWYAVTDRRVLISRRKRSGDELEAAFVDTLPAVSRDAHSVVFDSGASWRRAAFDGFGNNEDRLGFYDIRDAAYAADLVTRLRQRPPER